MIDEINEIVEGWKNLIFKNPVSEEIGKKRITKCIPCMHYEKLVKRCKICHCYMPAGVRSSKKRCPKGKW